MANKSSNPAQKAMKAAKGAKALRDIAKGATKGHLGMAIAVAKNWKFFLAVAVINLMLPVFIAYSVLSLPTIIFGYLFGPKANTNVAADDSAITENIENYKTVLNDKADSEHQDVLDQISQDTSSGNMVAYDASQDTPPQTTTVENPPTYDGTNLTQDVKDQIEADLTNAQEYDGTIFNFLDEYDNKQSLENVITSYIRSEPEKFGADTESTVKTIIDNDTQKAVDASKTETTVTDPPKSFYQIVDSFDGTVSDYANYMAISSFCASTGNGEKTDPDNYESEIDGLNLNMFSYTKSDVTQTESGNNLTVYTVSYTESNILNAFQLTADQTQQANQMVSLAFQIYGKAILGTPMPVGGMTVSPQFVDWLKQREGYCQYPDTTQPDYPKTHVSTIGYGHLNYENYPSLSPDEAETVLENDLVKYENAVNITFASTQLSQNQFDALVSFAYNVGCGAWEVYDRGQQMKEDIIDQADSSIIENDFLVFNKSGGNVVAGLTKRRMSEWEMFTYGYYS